MSTMKYEKEEYDDDEFSDHSGSITSDGDDVSMSEEEFEDEQRGGDHEEGADEHQVKRVKKNSKFDLPTKEEQMHLRETQNLMTANLLHLQVSEMINEVHDHKDGKLTNKRRKILAWLDEWKVNMKKISVKGGEVSNSWLKKYNIPHIKLENYTNETVLQFHPPSSVEVVGSFSLNTATKPYTNIDVVVTIPAECFDPRDILNHVYFDKRKLYLATIIRQLMSPSLKFKDTIDISSIKVAFFKGDTRKPIVCFKPNFKCPYVVRVIPVAHVSAFKLTQLRPQKNNVRPARWLEMIRTSSKKESEWDLSALSPTPYYNMAILEDLSLISQHNIVKKVLDICPGAAEAIVIAKVWLTQRRFRFGVDSLDGHGVSILITYLYHKRTINAQMNSFTIFQCLLKFLSEVDFKKEILSFIESPEGINFMEYFPAGLLYPVDDEKKDKVHLHNCLWRWSPSFVDEIQTWSQISLTSLMESVHSSSFNQVFMKPHNFFTHYDLIFHIPVINKKQFIEEFDRVKAANDNPFLVNLGEKTVECLHEWSAWEECSRNAREVIVRALGDRAVAVHTLSSPFLSPMNCERYGAESCIGSAHYPLLSCHEKDSDSDVNLEDMAYVSIGIVVSTAEGTARRVDRGPSASDEEECAKFTEFWGPKSRLRRFRDGTIVEAVVWGEDGLKSTLHADSIITEIVMYTMQRHLHYHCLGDASQNIFSVSNQLDYFLPVNNHSNNGNETSLSSVTKTLTHDFDARTLFRKAVESLDVLRKMMTSKISEFPLILESFSGSHPGLRYTSFIPPVQHPVVVASKKALNDFSGSKMTRFVNPLHVIASLSNSSRWPSDIKALRTAKSALIIRLSECVRKQFELKSIVHRDFLDIFHQGFVFRVHLFTDQEIHLLTSPRSHLILNKPEASHNFNKFDNEEACQLHRHMVIDPLHHAAIRGVSSRYNAFGDTVRLMICWRDNHMLSNHIKHEMIELLVASVFTNKRHLPNNNGLPCEHIPQSSSVAFLRTLLCLSQFDWEESMLLVDFLTYEDADERGLEKTKSFVEEVNIKFKSVKATHSEPAMSIGAQYDESNGFIVAYGLKTPDKSMLGVVTGLAKNCADRLSHWMSCPNSLNTSTIMLPEHNIMFTCDVILKFNQSIICGKRLKKLSGQVVMNNYVRGPTSARIEIFSNISTEEKSGERLVGRDYPLPHPLQNEVLKKLENEFGHLAIFFFNNIHGDQLGVRWKPDAFIPARFSLLQCRHHYISSSLTDSDKTGTMILNAAAVVAEMVNRSDGLIESVVYK